MKWKKKGTENFFRSQANYFVNNELKDVFGYKFLVLEMTVTKCNISKDMLYF